MSSQPKTGTKMGPSGPSPVSLLESSLLGSLLSEPPLQSSTTGSQGEVLSPAIGTTSVVSGVGSNSGGGGPSLQAPSSIRAAPAVNAMNGGYFTLLPRC